jgi:uncharacterized protein YndB with AHSA1/START domain
MNTDQIRKSIVVRANRAQVWRALSDPDEFGEWFGVNLNGSFKRDAHLRGKVTHKGYENYPFEITISRIDPEHLLSWRWHPNAVDPKMDYSEEPTTLVSFELEDIPGGTRVTLVESGFDELPESRRLEAYKANEKGWTMQMDAIQRHIVQAA